MANKESSLRHLERCPVELEEQVAGLDTPVIMIVNFSGLTIFGNFSVLIIMLNFKGTAAVYHIMFLKGYVQVFIWESGDIYRQSLIFFIAT